MLIAIAAALETQVFRLRVPTRVGVLRVDDDNETGGPTEVPKQERTTRHAILAIFIHVGDKVNWVSGGVLFHTVSFGIDPRKTPLLIPVATGPTGPTLALNPVISTPVMPAGGMYTGGVASSGLDLQGNYLNLPGQKYVKAAFSLTFAKAGTYTYNCLVHPGMIGTITVLPTGQ